MKNSSAHGFVNHLLVYALLGIGLSGTAGVAAVWMRQQISFTANANKALEARIADLTRRCNETNAAIAAEQDPSVLLRRNTAWSLGLVPPRDDQVQHVADDPVMRLAAKRNSGLYRDTGAAAVTFRVAAQP